MRLPLFARPLEDAEPESLKAGLRSSDAFTVRRCQILLASARGDRPAAIAASLGCTDQTVRNAIHAVHQPGLACLTRGLPRAHQTYPAFTPAGSDRLREIIHQSPRGFGQASSVWTLDLAAEVAHQQGLTARRVTGETVRVTLVRQGVRWRRAKQWLTSPDPEYTKKKARRDRLIRLAQVHPAWALGFEDAVWWSRVSQPAVRTWMDPDQPVRLLELDRPDGDPAPKALACYGLLGRWWPTPDERQEQRWLRFVDGRPVSAITTPFLAWCCAKLDAAGQRALLLVWDNAAWHVSQAVRAWLRAHNRQVKRTGQGVRIVSCSLPIKRPWLTPIEPKWVSGKRRVAEPDRVLPPTELAERVCEVFDCPSIEHLTLSKEAA